MQLLFGKSQRLNLVPYKADQELHGIIMEKVTEFWQKVDLDEPYPPLDNGKPYTINLDHLKTKNEVIRIAMDWAKADAEVREWTTTRQECQEALELVQEENRPRYPNLQWYLDSVGLDFEDVISKINAIPRINT